MITAQDIDKLFKDHDKRTKHCLKLLVDCLTDNDSVVPDYFELSLELLAVQFDLYFESKDVIHREGIYSYNKTSNRVNKSPAIQVMQAAYSRIIDMIKESGATSMSRKKLKKMSGNDKEDNAAKLLEALAG